MSTDDANEVLPGDAELRTLTNEDKDKIYRLLHVLWSKAVGTPDYVKQEWKDLSNLVEKVRKYG